jgi:hypothetical protein
MSLSAAPLKSIANHIGQTTKPTTGVGRDVMAKRDGGIGALSRWPDQLGGMERLQRIDGIDRLGFDVPFEHR